jgi:hypothetical protein
MFNRNNYAQLKTIPFLQESYTPTTYVVNNENMTLASIISDLDNKQQALILLDNQVSSFKLSNADKSIIQGLEAAQMGLRTQISAYQNVLSKNVTLDSFNDLLSYLNTQTDPPIAVQRQINFVKSIIQSKS